MRFLSRWLNLRVADVSPQFHRVGSSLLQNERPATAHLPVETDATAPEACPEKGLEASSAERGGLQRAARSPYAGGCMQKSYHLTLVSRSLTAGIDMSVIDLLQLASKTADEVNKHNVGLCSALLRADSS